MISSGEFHVLTKPVAENILIEHDTNKRNMNILFWPKLSHSERNQKKEGFICLRL